MSVHPPTARPSRTAAAASAVTSRAGVPWWAAVLIALVPSVLGAAIDALANGTLGWGLRIGFVLGVVAAALLVRRDSLFTAMVQPPIVLVVASMVGMLVFTSVDRLFKTALPIIALFPTMLIGTAAAIVIGVIRMVAQPIRPPSRRPAR